jgi:hypothetical protein
MRIGPQDRGDTSWTKFGDRHWSSRSAIQRAPAQSANESRPYPKPQEGERQPSRYDSTPWDEHPKAGDAADRAKPNQHGVEQPRRRMPRIVHAVIDFENVATPSGLRWAAVPILIAVAVMAIRRWRRRSCSGVSLHWAPRSIVQPGVLLCKRLPLCKANLRENRWPDQPNLTTVGLEEQLAGGGYCHDELRSASLLGFHADRTLVPVNHDVVTDRQP